MKCRFCGQPKPDGAERCPHCGALDPVFAGSAQNGTAPAREEPSVPDESPETIPESPENVPESDLPAQDGNVLQTEQTAPAAPKKARSGAWYLGLRFVIGLIIVALVTGGYNFIHQHSSFLSKGETVNMDELLKAGEDFPVGEFVHVDAAFVLDCFASEESRINGITSQKDSYYYVILNSRYAVAVKAAAVDDIAVLEKGMQDTLDYLDEKIDSFDDVPLEGKLVKMTDSKLTGYFDEYTEECGFNDADSKIKAVHYMIDMTEVRADKFLHYVGLPVAVIAVAVIVAVVVKKKKKDR